MHCNVYHIFVKFVRLTHSNKELLTYLLKASNICTGGRLLHSNTNNKLDVIAYIYQ